MSLVFTREQLLVPGGYRLILSDPTTGLALSRVVNENDERDWEDVTYAREHLARGTGLAAQLTSGLLGSDDAMMHKIAAVQRIWPGAVLGVSGEDVSLVAIDIHKDHPA